MTITDRDGLSAVQIAKIRRVELARYRKAHQIRHGWIEPAIGLFFGICILTVLFHARPSPKSELYTRLPNLDAQAPSITIYAK